MENRDICNCMALRRAARRISNFYDGELAPSGLRATQFSILLLLQRAGEASVIALAERLTLDRTTAGKNLRPLEQAGFIAVAPSRQDRRRRVVRLTAAGAAALETAMPLWRQAQNTFETANGGENVAALRQTLSSLQFGQS